MFSHDTFKTNLQILESMKKKNLANVKNIVSKSLTKIFL